VIQSIKASVRDAIPKRFQVPIRHWYGLLRGQTEAEMSLLSSLVRRGSRVADVGGNRGAYAYRLWKLGGRVEVFEPNPLCAQVLHSWAKRVSDVTVHPVALSSAEGRTMLHVPIGDYGIEHDASASIEPVAAGNYRDVQVPLRSLDSFGFVDLDFIKIDTEGHEMSVIAGAAATLKASNPALLIEIEQRHHREQPIAKIFNQIAQLGYQGFFLRNGRLIALDEFDVDRDQSLAAFAANDVRYLNNFLFLSAVRFAAGDYDSLAARWMAA
jgi:FkbM family methyltransferase